MWVPMYGAYTQEMTTNNHKHDTKNEGSKEIRWFARNPSKRWCEIFFLVYSPSWMIWALCIIVPFQLYERFDELSYFLVGFCAASPVIALPMLFQSRGDLDKPWYDRFWVKANLWIAIYSFIGNYFWTHYFYRVLGAAYTMKAWRLNDVPIVMYLMTHAYFCFYHALSNVLIRRVRTGTQSMGKLVQFLSTFTLVFTLSYFTAFMETLTISHYPYYTHKDKMMMYTVGSLFYAIYFFVSFPMFYALEEDVLDSKNKKSLWQVSVDSLGAGMLVTIFLDLWRLYLGPIVEVESCSGEQTLPWL
eukprot:TRINITY_DN3455_c0_g1_i4.p1 TRINITY_DN3455_c0_g1~~TRINITY_DN3455_c0_g1_i4.p1  ORF type:complete len:302 (-),score=13.83 TRINITY_DN3455_c0_g1_i4:728-1633(-)